MEMSTAMLIANALYMGEKELGKVLARNVFHRPDLIGKDDITLTEFLVEHNIDILISDKIPSQEVLFNWKNHDRNKRIFLIVKSNKVADDKNAQRQDRNLTIAYVASDKPNVDAFALAER